MAAANLKKEDFWKWFFFNIKLPLLYKAQEMELHVTHDPSQIMHI